MVIKSKENNVGAWAFLIGIILATIVGVFTSLVPIPSLEEYSGQLYALLVILGILVGSFIKIREKDSQTFLIAGTVLVIVSRFGMESVKGNLVGVGVGAAVSSVFSSLLVLFVPATIVVALKTVFSVARV
ncbi:MAG: hypothetical protein ABEI74_04615 [Candidatus Pacearchaeota archaeon]